MHTLVAPAAMTEGAACQCIAALLLPLHPRLARDAPAQTPLLEEIG